MSSRGWRSVNLFYVTLVAVFLYVPLLLLIVFSFNDAGTLAFPLSGFTFEWYKKLWATPELLRAAWNSVLLGVTSSVVATIICAMAAVGLACEGWRWPVWGWQSSSPEMAGCGA